VRFAKYHALENDFLVIDSIISGKSGRLGFAGSSPKLRSQLARRICHRKSGVGADGVLYLTKTAKADAAIEIYNADGGWAEKSGNGLRIAAVHLWKRFPRRKLFSFLTNKSIDNVRIDSRKHDSYEVTTELGFPNFDPASLPMKSKKKIMLNSPIKLGSVNIPVTCLSVGNPHTVMVVDSFDFDWQQLGADLEQSSYFPRGTNVEFVIVRNRRNLLVAEWERGAGATGSSGTGAAAACCAMVMLGLAERECKVHFDAGTLAVHWGAEDNIVSISGPVQKVSEGIFEAG